MVMWMIQYNVLDALCCGSFSLTMGNLNMSGKGVSMCLSLVWAWLKI